MDADLGKERSMNKRVYHAERSNEFINMLHRIWKMKGRIYYRNSNQYYLCILCELRAKPIEIGSSGTRKKQKDEERS
jgi:hypothetical protein